MRASSNARTLRQQEAGELVPMAGALTALAAFVNISGSTSAALLLHRGTSAGRLLMVGYMCMAITTLFAFGQFTQGMPVVRYGAVLVFSAVGGVIPGTLFMIAVSVAPSERTVSTAVGWVQQISSMGMFVMPPLLAKLAGWHWTWLALDLVGVRTGIVDWSTACDWLGTRRSRSIHTRA